MEKHVDVEDAVNYDSVVDYSAEETVVWIQLLVGGSKGEGEWRTQRFHGEHIVDWKLRDCNMPDSFCKMEVV